MEVVINLEPILRFLSLPLDQLLQRLFWLFGWIPIALTFLWGSAQVWLKYRRSLWGARQKYVFLAIDIPKGNQQTPKAVENMFAYLAGAHGTFNLHEKWWLGELQLSFSFEIVSIEGYTQFLVRTFEKYRDVLESAIYSQYPDAEITEVNDYTVGTPDKFPDDEYDLWGGEFIQTKPFVYPVKTYKDFEDATSSPDTQYKDSMAALMDLCASMKKGEQFWYQIIVIPTGFDWVKEAEKEINKIVGIENKTSSNIITRLVDGLLDFLSRWDKLFVIGSDEKKEEKEDTFRMMNLNPIQKKQVEEIEEKTGKLGYEIKIRVAYLAKKEVINKPKAGSGIVGFMKQFTFTHLNSFKPDIGDKGTITKVNYPIFAERRLTKKKNKVIRTFKDRDDTAGRTPMILNTEEIASLWHFPVETVVKGPLLQKTPAKKVEPPSSLPISNKRPLGSDLSFFSDEIVGSDSGNKQTDAQPAVKNVPPSNLPFV